MKTMRASNTTWQKVNKPEEFLSEKSLNVTVKFYIEHQQGELIWSISVTKAEMITSNTNVQT